MNKFKATIQQFNSKNELQFRQSIEGKANDKADFLEVACFLAEKIEAICNPPKGIKKVLLKSSPIEFAFECKGMKIEFNSEAIIERLGLKSNLQLNKVTIEELSTALTWLMNTTANERTEI